MQPNDIPVLMIIFNRPEKVRKLITALSAVKPKKIYIIADGPRKQVKNDMKSTVAARDAAIDIPWECEVHTKFLDENLRSKYNAIEYSAVVGIDWLFKENEMGIILEDDCIPHPSFFTFCAELLKRFENDEKVMHISGNNFQNGQFHGDGSYYFSLYSHSWGWATWKRAWDKFHPAVADMPNFIKENRIRKVPTSRAAQNFWLKSFRSQKHWDSLWLYTIWHENALSIIPNKNLVTNIGFGDDATNTLEEGPLSNLMSTDIGPITHPTTYDQCKKADEYIFTNLFYRPLWKRVIHKISDIIRKLWK